MSKIISIKRKCVMCGKESEQIEIMSTSSFGAPDLDLRPPQMQRSTMAFWVQKCPYCNYSAASIEKEKNITKEFLESDDYKTCEGNDFENDLVVKFYQAYMIAKEIKNFDNAFNFIKYAAWTFDDLKDYKNASICRLKAIDLLSKIENKDTNIKIVEIDMLRRASEYDKAIDFISRIKTNEELIQQILDFENKKCIEKDNKCYTVNDVVK